MTDLKDNMELKLEALEDSISYPVYKEVKDVHIIEVDTFDYDLIRDKIVNNERLTNLEGAQMNMLLEVIQLLSDNRVKFNVSIHNYIGFYWRGLPILALKYNNPGNEINSQRMMYVSVKVFKDELTQKLNIKRAFRWTGYVLGGAGLFGGLIVGYYYLKNRTSE